MRPVTLREYCQEARSFIESGEPRKAVLFTRHVLRHYPRHVESYRLLGQALLAAGNHQEASRQFRRVLSADPEDVPSQVGLAEIQQAAGDLDKAVWHMQRALELSPGDSQLRARLDRLSDAPRIGATPEASEMTRAALGRIHARAGLHDKAVREFKAVLAQNPDRLDVQTALAEALWRTGRHLEAAEVCQRILDRRPHALKANLIIAALWLQDKESDAAEPFLRLVQELDPENLVAQSLLGESSPLPLITVKIEPLGEDEIDRTQPTTPSAPAESIPASLTSELATDGMSKLLKEESTPMSDEERADEEFELPDWLKGVGDDLLEDKDDQPAAAGQPGPDSGEADETTGWLRDLVVRAEGPEAAEESVPAEPGDVPDWLRELRPELSEDTYPDSEAPDWLASVPADRTLDDLQPETASGPAAPEVPQEPLVSPEVTGELAPAFGEDQASWERFLAEEGVDLAAAEEAPPPGAAGMSAEEWLRFTSDLEPAPAVEGEPAAPAMPAAEAEVDEAGLPDWLREIQEAEAQPEAERDVGIAEPSLLEPLSDVVEDTDVPDWLREISAGEPVADEEAEPLAEISQPLPEVEVDEIGLPDWLREFEAPAAELEEAGLEPVSPEAAAEPLATAAEGRALWEQILEEGIVMTPLEEAPPSAEEPLPPAPELPALPLAEAEVAEVGRPDWLADLGEPAEEEFQFAAEIQAEAHESDLPDWLRQVAAGEPLSAEEVEPATPAAEAEPPEELPAWMRELQEPVSWPEPPAEAEPAEEAEEALEVEVDEAGLPDWLREPAAEAAEFPEPEVSPSAETPGWLAELETQDMFLGESDFEEPIELEVGEAPEWLGEIMDAEPPLAEEWAAEKGGEQLPDWLREFRQRAEAAAEPSAEIEEPEAPAEAELEMEYAPPSELPEWLVHLRAGVSEAEVPLPIEEPTLAEIEELLPEAPVEMEPLPPELEMIEIAEPEIVEEELLPLAEAARALAELPEFVEIEIEPVPVAAPVPELLGTRKLEALRAEDLPKDPAARLSMARAALNAGDWSDALMIYETLISSSELLGRVIDNLEVGVLRHPDDPAGYQLLGDACMKEGRLHDALEAYRTALTKL